MFLFCIFLLAPFDEINTKSGLEGDLRLYRSEQHLFGFTLRKTDEREGSDACCLVHIVPRDRRIRRAELFNGVNFHTKTAYQQIGMLSNGITWILLVTFWLRLADFLHYDVVDSPPNDPVSENNIEFWCPSFGLG